MKVSGAVKAMETVLRAQSANVARGSTRGYWSGDGRGVGRKQSAGWNIIQVLQFRGGWKDNGHYFPTTHAHTNADPTVIRCTRALGDGLVGVTVIAGDHASKRGW